MHIRQCNEAAAILRPTLENGQIAQRKVISIADRVHDLVARCFLYVLRARMQQMNSLFEQIPTFAQIGWRLRFQDELNFLGDISNVPDL